jgi:hypothetical protein
MSLAEKRVQMSEVIALIARTIGADKAAEAVRSAAVSLGFEPRGDLDPSQVRKLIDSLAHAPGLIGVAARYVQSRPSLTAMRVVAGGPARPAEEAQPSSAVRPIGSAGKEVRLPRREIADLLAASLGLEKAEEVVVNAAKRVGVPDDKFDLASALLTLEALAKEKGIVGIAASFAKARAILKFSPKV